MATVAKFLASYKNLETEIRTLNPNDSIYDYENRLSETDPAKAEKLKVCRINRNFIQHNTDGEKFVGVISDKWIEFLDNEANAIHSRNDLVKKHIYKATAIDEKTTINDAMDIVVKSKIDVVPVVGKKSVFIGTITPMQILVAYKKAGNIRRKILDFIPSKSIEKTKINYYYAKPTDRYVDYAPKMPVIITSDGKEDGTYIGVLK